MLMGYMPDLAILLLTTTITNYHHYYSFHYYYTAPFTYLVRVIAEELERELVMSRLLQQSSE